MRTRVFGGAVVMNAGYGQRSMGDVVVSARLLIDESVVEVPAGELRLGYRTSRLRGSPDVVLSARLRLSPGDPDAIAEEMRTGDAHRARTQPLQAPSCGSVFRS